VKKPIYYPADIRFLGAVRGLSELGYSASNAAPQLGLLLNNPKRGMGAVHALVSIGPSAVPILTEALTKGPPMVRYHALNGFVVFGPQAKSALTVVTNYLNDTNQIHGLPISLHAMRALKRMEPLFDPNVAAP
jgi:hypothetical protein